MCVLLMVLYFNTSLTLGFCIIKHLIGVNERAIKEEAQLTELDNACSVPSEIFSPSKRLKEHLLLIHLSALTFVMPSSIYV